MKGYRLSRPLGWRIGVDLCGLSIGNPRIHPTATSLVRPLAVR
jgi:hypothetical protein